MTDEREMTRTEYAAMEDDNYNENIQELATDLELAQQYIAECAVKMDRILDDGAMNKLIEWLAESLDELFFDRFEQFDDDETCWIDEDHEKYITDRVLDAREQLTLNLN